MTVVCRRIYKDGRPNGHGRCKTTNGQCCLIDVALVYGMLFHDTGVSFRYHVFHDVFQMIMEPQASGQPEIESKRVLVSVNRCLEDLPNLQVRHLIFGNGVIGWTVRLGWLVCWFAGRLQRSCDELLQGVGEVVLTGPMRTANEDAGILFFSHTFT